MFRSFIALIASISVTWSVLALVSVGAYFVSTNLARTTVVPMVPKLARHEASSDPWTECIIISGTVAPKESLPLYVLDPRVSDQNDPCPSLLSSIEGRGGTLADWDHYRRYWLGSIPLTALSLAAFGFAGTHMFFGMWFGLSLLLVAAAATARLDGLGHRIAAVVLIGGVALGAGITTFGGHFGHGPVFFLGLTCLAAMFACYRPTSIPSVIAGFAALGTVTGYYDMLSGGIPFICAIAAFLHMVLWYDKSRGGYAARPLGAAASLVAAGTAYSCGVVLPILAKIAILQYALGDRDTVPVFVGQLTWRMSTDRIGASGPLALWHVLDKLWSQRAAFYFGGEVTADIIYLAGLAGWVIAAMAVGLSWHRNRRIANVASICPPLVGAGIVIVWFVLFPSHGFIHSEFMGRVLSIVPALGLAAAVLALSPWLAGEPLPARAAV